MNRDSPRLVPARLRRFRPALPEDRDDADEFEPSRKERQARCRDLTSDAVESPNTPATTCVLPTWETEPYTPFPLLGVLPRDRAKTPVPLLARIVSVPSTGLVTRMSSFPVPVRSAKASPNGMGVGEKKLVPTLKVTETAKVSVVWLSRIVTVLAARKDPEAVEPMTRSGM